MLQKVLDADETNDRQIGNGVSAYERQAKPLHINVDNVSKIYAAGDDTKIHAVEHLDLQVFAGEFVCIVGPSGCGKSTLLSMLAGLEQPTAGTLAIKGKPLTSPSNDVAMVFQEHSLFPWKTIVQNVEIGLKARGVQRALRRQKALDVIRMAGLQGFEDKHPCELSGGMRQRVGIARALAVDPDVLLMDEPFGALDAQTRLLFQEELLKIYDKFRKTIVFVTHSVQEAIFLADRVIIMTYRPGRIKSVIDVPIPRPRVLEVVNEKEFDDIRAHVWETLRKEASKAFVESGNTVG